MPVDTESDRSLPSGPPWPPGFERWLHDLERRHLADLTFSEVSRALAVLSATYVQRRTRLSEGIALSGRGKRAAFALFYAPLHFVLVHALINRLPHAREVGLPIVDLGCGTGAAGLAWAAAGPGRQIGRAHV